MTYVIMIDTSGTSRHLVILNKKVRVTLTYGRLKIETIERKGVGKGLGSRRPLVVR